MSDRSAAVALRPDLAGVRVNVGNAYRAIGDLDAAVSSHREALAIDPRLPEAHNNLANALRDQGEITEAIAHWREVLRIDPAYRGGQTRLGVALSQMGAREEALAALEKAIQAEPADIETITARAEALKHAGRFADAQMALKRAHSLAGDNPAQTFFFELHLAETEKLIQAERDLAKIEKGTAILNDPESIWLAAWVCHLLRRDSTAVKLVEKALRDDPDREHCANGQSELFHVVSALRTANQPLAMAWLRGDLDRLTMQSQSTESSVCLSARRTVRLWQQHLDLSTVRAPASLATLPEFDRIKWLRMWADADAMLKRTDKPK